ncbi:helix-turn-helix transcriptional regulator [Kitasatospora sp. NPDC049285]|uniref:response regulator transcription factor n=1 Tax=Kitasatospora sp. NPDC049285 TaxID=3157096 RepID=UPI00343EDCBA
MPASTPPPPLSPREIEVLGHLAQGLTYSTIARRLQLSPHTVETYLRRIRAKTGSANRAQLALLTVTLRPRPGQPSPDVPEPTAQNAQPRREARGGAGSPTGHPDAPGTGAGTGRPSTPPDPSAATTPGEFVQHLRQLKAWSGEPSLRRLEKTTGLPRSTLAQALDTRRDSLPPLERVTAIVSACGVPQRTVDLWKDAWRRIRMQHCLVPDHLPATAREARSGRSVAGHP